jgi:hypothetical protein
MPPNTPGTLDRLMKRARGRLARLQPVEAWAAVEAGSAVLVDIRPAFQRRSDGRYRLRL